MGRKAILEARLQRLETKKADLVKRSDASEDINEVRSITEKLREIGEDMEDIRAEIAALDTEERAAAPAPAFEPAKTTGTYIAPETKRGDVLASMEYRKAWKDYVQRGTPIPAELRSGDNVTTTDDLGALIPTTVMSEIIKNVQKVYGQLYAKVRKMNVKGGVKFPISDLKASFKWINESTVSPRQQAGTVNEYVEFSYNIGEIRVSQSLLSSIVALDLFEAEVVRIMTEAYLEAMDKGIISGTGNGQMLGILNDARVTNVVTFTAAQLADWTQWRKRLFSLIPLSKRGQGEFIFTASTVESYLLTMQDGNGRPLFREATDLTLTDSNNAGKFFGRDVTLVEPDVLDDFGTASANDVFGVLWVPSDYAINSQMTFGVKRYFDDETNQWVNKGLTVIDGKLLDVSGCYILKKGS